MKTGVESWALLSPEGTYHKLCEPNFFVGREDDMDLTLKSRSVDKQHAVISVDVENREYQLHDLGTLNGTFVNDVRVKQQPLNLKLRDNIRFGYDLNTFRVELCPERKRQPSFDEERHQYHGNDSHPLETVWESNRSQPAPERKLSIQSSAHQANSDEDVGHPGTPDQDLLHMYHGVHSPHTPGRSQFHSYPHYPYMTPMYHHPPPVMCHCPSCTGHQSPVHSPHGVHHQMSPHTGWSHAPPTTFQVRPRLQRPLSAPGPENFKMIVKGSPLYGQPPWWGWGSSDDEIYNYPNTATLVEGEAKGVQQALSMRKKKLTKKDALEMTQRRHSIGTVSVLSESKARIVTTRTSNSTYVPEQLMNQRDEFRVHQKNSSLPSPGYSDQLSPVFENSTSRDWEMLNSHGENAERGSNLTEYDSSMENSADDSNDGHSRPAYEIPFIPDYDEIPERPVSQKSNKGKQPTRDDVRSSASTGDKQDRTTRKKPISKIKKRIPGSEAVIKDGKTSSVSRKHSSDTSESECEPSSHPSRRSGVVTRGIPSSSRVFGLTEVSLQRVRDGDSRENLTPAALPNWVQQWANTIDNLDNCSGRQPIEVLGSSSSTEDSTFSSGGMSSSSQIPVPLHPDDTGERQGCVNVACVACLTNFRFGDSGIT